MTQCLPDPPQYMRQNVHDWRLWEREKKLDPDGKLIEWREVWYCTRCRLVEERSG